MFEMEFFAASCLIFMMFAYSRELPTFHSASRLGAEMLQITVESGAKYTHKVKGVGLGAGHSAQRP